MTYGNALADARINQLEAEITRLTEALVEAKAQNNYPLPCHVLLPPATRIGPGVPLSVLVTAVKQRDGRNVEFSSAFKALDDLTAAQATIAKMQEALTPSTETKAAYIGEFTFDISAINRHGEAGIQSVMVPWNTTKQIMTTILARATRAALASPAEKEG